jgi:hypothetical protein
MTAIHLHFKADVGTTYKRALKRFHHSRDVFVPRNLTLFTLIEWTSNWCALNAYLRNSSMRKPRDFDSELRALNDKARQLRARKVDQLGELVIACGADALSIEQLAGALLEAAEANPASKEAWRRRGAVFFRKRGQAGGSNAGDAHGVQAGDGAPAPSSGKAGAR